MSNNVTGQKITSSSAIEIVNKISSCVAFKKYMKGHRFHISATESTRIYLIKSGILSINKQPNDILLRLFCGPAIRGIKIIPEINFEYTVKVLSTSEIAIIEYSEFCQFLARFNLWELYIDHLHCALAVAGLHFVQQRKATAYEIVKIQLMELMAEPVGVRYRINAEHYIKSKTGLSRSSIMSMLAKLKNEGYMTIVKGILISMEKLPDDIE